MSRIAFFSIPAYGHTNPTVEVVRELTRRGHEVRYYSFSQFRQTLTEAGAQVIVCDGYLPKATPRELEKKVGRDFSALVAMTVDTTLAMEEPLFEELRAWEPECVVADSVCFWGKLFAWKLGAPFVCSVTTFAFNGNTAGMLRQGPGELVRMLLGMPLVNRKLALLRRHGYPVRDLVSLMGNNNETDAVVYTSRAFQPMAETFSDRYAFVGPSVAAGAAAEPGARRLVYISLGTVLNRNAGFYRSCVDAFRDTDWEVLLSVGERTDLAELGQLPENVTALPRVDQMAVLRRAAVFVTHCGMNSANEAICCGVPTVLYPQQSEEAMVAARMEELGVGAMLKESGASAIRAAVEQVWSDPSYREKTRRLAEGFAAAGGASAAADKILQVLRDGRQAKGASEETAR